MSLSSPSLQVASVTIARDIIGLLTGDLAQRQLMLRLADQRRPHRAKTLCPEGWEATLAVTWGCPL